MVPHMGYVSPTRPLCTAVSAPSHTPTCPPTKFSPTVTAGRCLSWFPSSDGRCPESVTLNCFPVPPTLSILAQEGHFWWTPLGIEKRLPRGWSKPRRAAQRQRDEASGYPIHSTPAGMLLGTWHRVLEAPHLFPNHICDEEHVSLQVKYKSILSFLKKKRRIIKIKISLQIHQKDWYWSWSFNTLAIWCEELTTGKDPDAGKDWRQEEKGMIG